MKPKNEAAPIFTVDGRLVEWVESAVQRDCLCVVGDNNPGAWLAMTYDNGRWNAGSANPENPMDINWAVVLQVADSRPAARDAAEAYLRAHNYLRG